MEMIDVFDEDMKPIGVFEKKKAHDQELWHKSVHIWLTDGEGVLVQLRSAKKKHLPNLWDVSVAGHLFAGETPLEGAIREYQEELGLKWPFGTVEHDGIIANSTWEKGLFNNEFAHLYFLKDKLDLSKIKLEKDEVAEVKYVPFTEFEEFLSSPQMCPHSDAYNKIVLQGLGKLIN
ncbi:MAG: NUDIX domain-containing protein [Firmicutes bacterium]|nr:NUDIX domain-containing protein [Bacillota bacterium]